MKTRKVIGLVLLLAGLLAFAYGSFTYTKETHDASLGPLELEIKDKETVEIPAWASITALVLGVALITVPSRS